MDLDRIAIVVDIVVVVVEMILLYEITVAVVIVVEYMILDGMALDKVVDLIAVEIVESKDDYY